MTHISVTVFFDSTSIFRFNITNSTTLADLYTSIIQRIDLTITHLHYHKTDRNRIGTISSEIEWDTLKKNCNTGYINLLSSSTPLTFAPSVFTPFTMHQDHDPYYRHQTHNFTSQFKRFGQLMDDYNRLIQRDEQARLLMQQTANDLTLQRTTIDWTALEKQLESRQEALGNIKAKRPSARSAPPPLPSWHLPLSHLAQRSTNHSSHDIPVSNDSPRTGIVNILRSVVRHQLTYLFNAGSIWGAYPAYSALYPAPSTSTPILDSHQHQQKQQQEQQRSPTSLYPQPPPVLPQRPSSSTTIHDTRPPISRNKQAEQHLYMAHHKALKKGQEEERRYQQQTVDDTSAIRKSTSLTSLSSSSTSTVSSCALSDLDVWHQGNLTSSPLQYPSIPPPVALASLVPPYDTNNRHLQEDSNHTWPF